MAGVGALIVGPVGCVLAWFGLSLSIGSLMKYCYLFSNLCAPGHDSDTAVDECRTYDFPVFITGVHMLVSWAICSLFVGRKAGGKKSSKRAKAPSPMSLKQQLRQILPLAGLFAVSVGFGNVSLTYLYPSFNQMVSTTTPLITMIMQMVVVNARYNNWALVSVGGRGLAMILRYLVMLCFLSK